VVQHAFFPVNDGIYFIPWPGANRKSSIQFLSFPTAKVSPISGSPRSALSVSPDGTVPPVLADRRSRQRPHPGRELPVRLQKADCLASTLIGGIQTGAQHTRKKTRLAAESSSLGHIVVSLDRECLGGKTAAFRAKKHTEAFSIRRLEGGRWRLQWTPMGFEWRCDRKAGPALTPSEHKSTHAMALTDKAAEKSASQDWYSRHY
jgi:hypothetical protein